jgi:hypothetical protein
MTTYTILSKLENGLPNAPAGGLLGGSGPKLGRPMPRPAPLAPPPLGEGIAPASMSLSLKLGFNLLAPKPPPLPLDDVGIGNELAARKEGCCCWSDRETLLNDDSIDAEGVF